MSPPWILCLIRFGKFEHLDELRRTGRLRMSRLASYHELRDNVGRGDRYDGLSAVLQPGQIRMTVMDIDIPSSDVVGPIKISNHAVTQSHVFCMHAVTSNRAQGHVEQNEPLIAAKNLDLGTHALVVTNGQEFINRVKKAAKNAGCGLKAGLVRYIDPHTHHGWVDAFTKFEEYSYQSEWRILIPATEEEIFWLSLPGSIEDISIIVPVSELASSFTMKFNE